MTKLSPQQIEILRQLKEGRKLTYVPPRHGVGGRWEWDGGVYVDGWAASGMLKRRFPPMELDCGTARLTPVGIRALAALAEAQKEGGK